MFKILFLLLSMQIANINNALASKNLKQNIDSIQKDFAYKTCNYHEFNFMILKVYDAYLCTNNGKYFEPGKIYETDFSLILRYNMNFDKDELAKSSIEEINRYYQVTKKDQQLYYKKLMAIFPDVKKGGQIEARYNESGFVELFYNKKLTGKITDSKFSRIFLDIWLYKDSKYKEMINNLFKK